MGPLAAYIRAHGVPLMLNGYVADFLEGKVGKGTRIQQRSAQILHFMWGHRRHHEQELKRIKLDPSYQPMFSTVRAIQEYAAERFYGSADRWATVEKLEQRQKR